MKKTILIAAVMFFALSVSAFAQSTFTVGSEGLDRVACCGLAEPTGALNFTATTSSPATVAGAVQIRYSLPIANTGTTLAAAQQVQVTPAAGTTATLASATNDAVTGNGIVVVNVGAGVTGAAFRVSNVRVNVSTSCGINPVTVAITSSGNLIEAGENNATVLNGVAPALLAPTVTPTAGAAVNAANGNVNGAAAPGTVTINVQEGFLNAFGVTPATDATQTVGHVVRLTVTGTLPTGVSLVFPATANTDGTGVFTRSTAAGAPAATDLTVTTLPATVYYVLTTDSNPALQETLSVPVTVNTAGPFPLAPGTVSVSAHIGPIATSGFPRYSDTGCETAAVTLLTVSGAKQTVLLVPYAVDLGQNGDYQTGIVVSNTTEDPVTANLGFPVATIPQTGKIVVYFFPADQTKAPFTWTSTDHTDFGHGLDTAGKVPSGGQFVAMVWELLPATTPSFSGYLFIVTDFTNAHGEFFISNFENFTHGALMLVVPPSPAGRTAEEGLDN